MPRLSATSASQPASRFKLQTKLPWFRSGFDADSGTEGLQASLARAAGMDDFATLRSTLAASAGEVYEIFLDTIEEPARKLGAEPAEGTIQP